MGIIYNTASNALADFSSPLVAIIMVAVTAMTGPVKANLNLLTLILAVIKRVIVAVFDRIFWRSIKVRHPQRQHADQVRSYTRVSAPVTASMVDSTCTLYTSLDVETYLRPIQDECALSYLTEDAVRLLINYKEIIQTAMTSFKPTSCHPEILAITQDTVKSIADYARFNILLLCKIMRGYHGFTMKTIMEAIRRMTP